MRRVRFPVDAVGDDSTTRPSMSDLLTFTRGLPPVELISVMLPECRRCGDTSAAAGEASADIYNLLSLSLANGTTSF
eukprot:m.200478 g.200478  ORF g.200478 m.200478 type:complete len:77 (+) comp15338_c0_seq1:718-948(+)